MSGIAGLLSLDGRPVDGGVLNRLTAFMAFRGPDAQETWNGGRVGFGHTMLRTTLESRRERQPLALGDDLWIVADARVDGRSELCRKLRSCGRDCRQDASDAELILHAYRAWGDECVRHLIGDFAFAIWDAPRERLFCARDHFGVKPFFYARVGDCLVFSNTLNCVREHPHVSDELNDRAIVDFLLLGMNQDDSSTAFAGIARLPPAHRMSWSGGTLRVDRYWHLPTEGHLRYRSERDYVDQFTEHLNAAVSDRLRGNRIGILMSGGLDSTSIAATARALLSGRHEVHELRAYTGVYDRLFADQERHFSGLAADALGIPIHYLAADDHALFEGWRRGELAPPEPDIDPLATVYLDLARQILPDCRVVLTGLDGDALLGENANAGRGPIYKSASFARRAARMGWRALSQGRWPRLNLRARLARMLPGSATKPFACPPWLKPDLIEQFDLPARWGAAWAGKTPRGCSHPEAHRVLTAPLLGDVLESYDPGRVGVPIEARHPLLDLRVVEYVLSLPPSPWCIDKELLRLAMRGRLPEALRLRPKAPLARDPVIELLQRDDARWVDTFEASPALDRYVDRSAVPPIAGTPDAERMWTDLRPLCLNFWLQHLSGAGRASGPEEYHEVA